MTKSKSETVEDLMEKLYKFPAMTAFQRDNIIDGLRSLGPGCVFDDLENDEQRKGAAIILGWIYSFLIWEPEITKREHNRV